MTVKFPGIPLCSIANFDGSSDSSSLPGATESVHVTSLLESLVTVHGPRGNLGETAPGQRLKELSCVSVTLQSKQMKFLDVVQFQLHAVKCQSAYLPWSLGMHCLVLSLGQWLHDLRYYSWCVKSPWLTSVCSPNSLVSKLILASLTRSSSHHRTLQITHDHLAGVFSFESPGYGWNCSMTPIFSHPSADYISSVSLLHLCR